MYSVKLYAFKIIFFVFMIFVDVTLGKNLNIGYLDEAFYVIDSFIEPDPP